MSDNSSVLAHFQLIDHAAMKTCFEIFMFNLKNYSPSEILQSMKIDYKIISVEETEEDFQGALELLVQIKIKEGKKNAVKCDLCMLGFFVSLKSTNVTRETFENMLKYNGITSLYSICRAHITTISGISSKLYPIHLPMINVINFIEVQEKNRSKTVQKKV